MKNIKIQTKDEQTTIEKRYGGKDAKTIVYIYKIRKLRHLCLRYVLSSFRYAGFRSAVEQNCDGGAHVGDEDVAQRQDVPCVGIPQEYEGRRRVF